jgi:hypothetical protein
VLVAHVTRSYVVFGYNVLAIRAALGLRVSQLARALWPFAASGAVMVAAILAMRLATPAWPPLATMIAGGVTGTVAYGGALLLGERLGWWHGILPLIRESLDMIVTVRGRAGPVTVASDPPSPDE